MLLYVFYQLWNLHIDKYIKDLKNELDYHQRTWKDFFTFEKLILVSSEIIVEVI